MKNNKRVLDLRETGLVIESEVGVNTITKNRGLKIRVYDYCIIFVWNLLELINFTINNNILHNIML